MGSSKATLNAKVGGVALLAGSVALHLANQIDISLQPTRLFIIGVLVLGAWSFSDEMGLRKPLNRVALICFVFSMLSLAVTVLEPNLVVLQKYYLIYAFTLLCSVLIWSIAFLHRQRNLQLAGAVGVVASILPLLGIVIGQISVGAGAIIGIQVLFQPSAEVAVLTSTPIRLIEAVFILWSGATAIFLWRGGMTKEVL